MGIIFDLYYGKMQPFCERENSSSEYCKKVEKLLEIEAEKQGEAEQFCFALILFWGKIFYYFGNII